MKCALCFFCGAMLPAGTSPDAPSQLAMVQIDHVHQYHPEITKTMPETYWQAERMRLQLNAYLRRN